MCALGVSIVPFSMIFRFKKAWREVIILELYPQWCIFCDDIHTWILVCKNVYLLKEKALRIISGLRLRQLFSLMHMWHYLILATILFRSFGFIACMDDFLNYLVFQSFDGDDGDSRNLSYALTIWYLRCYFNNISVILWRLSLLFVELDVCTNLRQIWYLIDFCISLCIVILFSSLDLYCSILANMIKIKTNRTVVICSTDNQVIVATVKLSKHWFQLFH